MSKLIPVAVGGVEEPGVDLLAVACFEDEPVGTARLTAEVAALSLSLSRRSGWTGATRQRAEATLGEGGGGLALYGLGKRERFDADRLTAWLLTLTQEADRQRRGRLVVVLPEHSEARGTAAARRIGRQLGLGGYRFDPFRGDARDSHLRSVTVVPEEREADRFAAAFEQARPIAGGVALARDLGNTPPNEATPMWIADRAQELADSRNMRIQILGEKEMADLGMGGILAVGAGSSNPSRLVCLEWGEGEQTVALVGKGVTFDTGGISIKPARAMDEMKYDKCGACTVLGIAQAVADLEIPVRLRVYLALAENMLGGNAYRPGDIIRCFNGKTVEVLNTDAEGRMVLADAIAWAARQEPDHLLEMSTLTGACVVALGTGAAGLYSPDDRFADGLLAAAEASGERLWRMPLWPEFRREMEGHHADLRNIGGRWGGANSAAAFLSNFVGGVGSWAHMDIAGPAARGSDQKEPRGATGYGVALATGWMLDRGAD